MPGLYCKQYVSYLTFKLKSFFLKVSFTIDIIDEISTGIEVDSGGLACLKQKNSKVVAISTS